MKFGRTGRVMTRGTAWILAVVLVLCTSGTHGAAWTITAQAAEKDEGEEDCILSMGHGNHSAAVREDGSLWLWGYGYYGQLGDGRQVEGTAGSEGSYSLVPIRIMENVRSVSLGDFHSAAIKEDGSLWMWGGEPKGTAVSGCLGYGRTEGSPVPVKVMENVRSVSLGSQHSAAIKNDGSLWIWGRGECLGNGSKDFAAYSPVQVMLKTFLPAEIEPMSQPKIRVIDPDGRPIEGAEVTYRENTQTTSYSGIIELADYESSFPLTILHR